MSQKVDGQARSGGTGAADKRLIVKTTMAPGESFEAFTERIIAAFRAAGCLAGEARHRTRTSKDNEAV